jgi:hypothetical protein
MIKIGYLAIFAAIAWAFAMCATGCSGLMESTKNKQVGIDTEIYGLKVTAFDPESGSFAPVGAMGFGSINYRSVPVEAGQPYYARYTTRGIWRSEPSTETVIWIGRATDKATLTFEAVPDTMIKISGDGVKSGTAEVKINSDVK